MDTDEVKVVLRKAYHKANAEAVTELLADLRWYCNEMGFSFGQCSFDSNVLYKSEVNDEK